MFTFRSHAPYGRRQAEPVGRISCNLNFDCKYVRYVTCMSRVTLHYITLKINTTATEFYFRRSCFVLAHVQMLRYYTYLLTATSISVASSGIAPQKYIQLHDSFVLIEKMHEKYKLFIFVAILSAASKLRRLALCVNL